MMSDLKYISRKIDGNLKISLIEFITHLKSSSQTDEWPKSYQAFLDLSYQCPRIHRPSISQLSGILKDLKISRHAAIAVRYGKDLTAMALDHKNLRFRI
jgi:hypothetical protein